MREGEGGGNGWGGATVEVMRRWRSLAPAELPDDLVSVLRGIANLDRMISSLHIVLPVLLVLCGLLADGGDMAFSQGVGWWLRGIWQ